MTTTLPEWVTDVTGSLDPPNSASIKGLAQLLASDDEVPPALREICRRFLTPPLARVDHPRARTTDPQESHEAAEKARAAALRPGGPVHKILARLKLLDGWQRTDLIGLTGRELTEGGGSWQMPGEADLPLAEWDGIPGAWKRCSELAADGLIRQATVIDGKTETPLTRKGSRVWIITDDGLKALDQLDELRRQHGSGTARVR